MKLRRASIVMISAGMCGCAATDALLAKPLNLTPQNNHNGWVNPEDLPPMPQCIAQQDTTNWLKTMTECTGQHCTSHLGPICTHHQWLTQVSCLSVRFSPNIIQQYLPYCNRSVLAKEQLYQWVRRVTGRTWLVEVGDADGLHNLSPASLLRGYASVEVLDHAPNCLTDADSAFSSEAFQHVLASCAITGTTQHTGNAARTWEYQPNIQSIIPFGFETVGYNRTGSELSEGHYFDKACFCGAFTIDAEQAPCAGLATIDLTREHLWMNATCGTTSVPDHWKDAVQTTEFKYIPVENWHWPQCVVDVTSKVTELVDQCTTDACELDSLGYCDIRRSVDRACFCQDIHYRSCGGSCQNFPQRIDYLEWLRELCAKVPGWHGLPDNWDQLITVTRPDMIPPGLKLPPPKDGAHGSESMVAADICAKTARKLGSVATIHAVTIAIALVGWKTGIHGVICDALGHLRPRFGASIGISIATVQIMAYVLTTFVIRDTKGYQDVSVIPLILLWCSMPRPTLLATYCLRPRPSKVTSLHPTAPFLLAEMIFQVPASYCMILTVNYGREHRFYQNFMQELGDVTSAKVMYLGAGLWLLVAVAASILSMALPRHSAAWFRETMDETECPEKAALMSGGSPTVYGTLSAEHKHDGEFRRAPLRLTSIRGIILSVLWVAQWLFWGGFIVLTLDGYVSSALGFHTR